MQKPLVSIIIPVYNVEKYLSKCIQSSISQTYRNIEIILVDDGSTDQSVQICNDFENIDQRIRVVYQNNSGVSSARNTGIDIATGDYIKFVDSDDFMEYDMIEKLVEAIYKNQMVICGFKSVYRSEQDPIVEKYITPIEGTFNKHDFMNCFGILFKGGFINSPCNKLYSTYLIKNNNIKFIESISMGEDLLFNLDYINVCESIKVIKESSYNYVNYNNDSITKSFIYDLFSNQQMLFFKVRCFLSSYNSYTGKNADLIELAYTDSIVGCFEQLAHQNSSYTSITAKEYITQIVNDSCVRNNVSFFKSGNYQKRLIGFLVKNKSIRGIFFYIYIKNKLSKTIKPIYTRLKYE